MEKVHQEEQAIAKAESRLLVERYLLEYGKHPFLCLLKECDREEMPKIEHAIQQLEAESQTEAYALREIAKTADELIAEANEHKKQRGRLKDEMVRIPYDEVSHIYSYAFYVLVGRGTIQLATAVKSTQSNQIPARYRSTRETSGTLHKEGYKAIIEWVYLF